MTAPDGPPPPPPSPPPFQPFQPPGPHHHAKHTAPSVCPCLQAVSTGVAYSVLTTSPTSLGPLQPMAGHRTKQGPHVQCPPTPSLRSWLSGLHKLGSGELFRMLIRPLRLAGTPLHTVPTCAVVPELPTTDAKALGMSTPSTRIASFLDHSAHCSACLVHADLGVSICFLFSFFLGLRSTKSRRGIAHQCASLGRLPASCELLWSMVAKALLLRRAQAPGQPVPQRQSRNGNILSTASTTLVCFKSQKAPRNIMSMVWLILALIIDKPAGHNTMTDGGKAPIRNIHAYSCPTFEMLLGGSPENVQSPPARARLRYAPLPPRVLSKSLRMAPRARKRLKHNGEVRISGKGDS